MPQDPLTLLQGLTDNQEAAPQSMPQPEPEQSPEDKLWASIQEEEKKALLDFSVASIYLKDLTGSWNGEVQRTNAQRMTRDVDIDVDALRESGDIEEDECFIPERIIDSNIQREMPSYINYLKNSRRLAIFNDKLDPTFDCSLLEDEFTKKMAYKGWTKPWFKLVDGSMTHGWASFEVVYDGSKPGNCGIEYIAHEDLLFAHDSKDLQASSCVLRRYRPTPLQLKSWVVKYGFSILQVNSIIEKYKEKGNKDKTIEVFKRFCKFQGAVYVSWFSLEGSCTDWLKAPAKLYVGVDDLVDEPKEVDQPVLHPVTGQPILDPQTMQPMTQKVSVPNKVWKSTDVENYPLFLYYYRESEKPLLFDHIGRVFLDKDKQEATTAIVTAFVNGINRAQKIYASPKTDGVNDGKPAKQLANMKWVNGTIFDKPMEFWNMPYPDPMVLKALQYFDVSNSQDIGQTDFAALNRQDSRKTATEITAASQQSQLLDSVDLTLFSEFCREVFSFCWLIIRSQALQTKINFLRVKKPAQPAMQPMGINPQGGLPQMPPQQNMGPLPMQPPPQFSPEIMSIVNSQGTYANEQSNYINDTDTLVRDFDVRAAGDVDVIQKAEMTQQMQADWPVIQQTPLAQKFLVDLIKLKYPQDGYLYATILEQGDPKNGIIQSLGIILQTLVKMPEVAHHITPQMMAQLQAIEQEAMQVLNPQGQSSQQPQQQKAA